MNAQQVHEGNRKKEVNLQPKGSRYILTNAPNTNHVIVGVFPPTGLDEKGFSIGIPMGLLHSVAFLDEAGYQLQLIDQRIDKNWRNSIHDVFAQNNVKYFVVSTMTGAQLCGAIESSKLAKELNPDVIIIWGGVHPSLLPHQTLGEHYIDYVHAGYWLLVAGCWQNSNFLQVLILVTSNWQPVTIIDY